jgi:hypothetical protein
MMVVYHWWVDDCNTFPNGVPMVHVTSDIGGPDLTPFLIPFTKVMHLMERKKLLNSLAKYSKLRELQIL